MEDEYGLDVCSGVSSVKNRSGLSRGRSPYTSSVDTWPYTSSVDTWWNLFTPHLLDASISTDVPMMFVRRNISGSSMLLSTWLSAAKFTTTSGLSSSKRE